LQNDFAARMDWCVRDREAANHPPQVKLAGELVRKVRVGEHVMLDASTSSDPDGDRLAFEWILYPEASGYGGPIPSIDGHNTAKATLAVSAVKESASLHVVLAATDDGTPPLTRYARVVLEIAP
jgi:hypothetical protein